MAFVYAANYTPNGFGSILGTGDFFWIDGHYILGNTAVAVNVANGSGNQANLTFANSVITGAFNGINLDGSDRLTLTDGGTISSGARGIYSSGGFNDISIGGTIASENIAIDLNGNSNSIALSGAINSDTTAMVVNGNSNNVMVTGSIMLNTHGDGVHLNGTSNDVMISGSIFAATGSALETGGFSTVSISGDLESLRGVEFFGGGNEVLFTGTQYGHFGGFSFTGDHNQAEIGGMSVGQYDLLASQHGDHGRYVISGTLSSGRSAIHIQDGTDNMVTITATGVVSGGANDIGDPDDCAGAILFDSESGEENTLINYGSITANLNTTTNAIVAVVDAEFTDEQPGFVENTSGILNFYNYGTVHGDIYLGAGNDLYDGAGGSITSISEIYLGRGDDLALGGDGREEIYGDAGNDTIEAGAGKDRIYDGAGDDSVQAGEGKDYVRVGGGEDSYSGGEGKDYISYYDSPNGVTLDLEANSGSRSWAANDYIEDFESAGGSRTGDDRLYGTSGSNTLNSYGGSDRLYGRGGSDKLDGGSGADSLYGGGGADRLFGGSGADFLNGGSGEETDLLYGEGGSDVFHFDLGEGYDIIKDFADDTDTLEFDDFDYLSDAASALAYASESGGDVLFDFGADGRVLVENATLAQLSNDIDIV